MPLGNVKIAVSRSGLPNTLELDGVDIAKAVTGVRVDATAGCITQVTVDILAAETTVSGKAKLLVSPESHALLVRFGWTPPADEPTA